MSLYGSVSESGVSWRWLRAWASSIDSSLSIDAIVETIIIPKTKIYHSSFARLLSGGGDQPNVNQPTYYVSYSRQATLSTIMHALTNFLSEADPNTTYLWFDIFAMNQKRGEATMSDMEDIEKSVQGAKEGTLVVLDPTASQLTRTWVWFEIWATLKVRGFEELHWLTPGFTLRDVSGPFIVADVRQSATFHSSERSKLIEFISGTDGKGLRDINSQLRLAYILNPLDSRQVLSRVLTSPSWRFGTMMQRNLSKWTEKYANWLSLVPSHPNYKCLWIAAPPGSGKTSLVAGICTLVGSSKEGIDLRPHAYHFITKGDKARINPIACFRTWAYQLALNIEATQQYFLNLDFSKLNKLTNIEQAFNILIRVPLSRLARDGKVPGRGVILTLDGLDEADERDGFENHLLMCVKELFPLLPTFCRLLCTSRTDTEAPHIAYNLRSKLLPMELSPPEFFVKDDLRIMLEQQLSGIMEHKDVPEATDRIMRRGRQSFIYYHVVTTGMQDKGALQRESHTWTLDELRTLPTDLPNAYAAIFSGCLARLSVDGVDVVTRLLEVISAAREPLSLAQINGMDLSSAVSLLPGFGRLFYVQGLKVRVFHSTLLDWLRSLDPKEGLSHDKLLAAAEKYSSQVNEGVSTLRSQSNLKSPNSPTRKPKKKSAQIVATALEENLDEKPGLRTQSESEKLISSFAATAASSADNAAEADAPGSPSRTRSLFSQAGMIQQRLASIVGQSEDRPVMTQEEAENLDLTLNLTRGHVLIAAQVVKDLSRLKQQLASGARLQSEAMSNVSFNHGGSLNDPLAAYALRHAVAHLCLSGDSCMLESLLLDFDFWQSTYAAGYGPSSFSDLLDFMPSKASGGESPVALDVARWLRGVNETLVVQPRAALQLAADAPRSSFTAQAAMKFHRRPDGILMSKEVAWSPNLAMIREPRGSVTGVCFSPDGSWLASGSTSKSVRLWGTRSATQRAMLEGPSSTFNAVAMYPDGSHVVAGSLDKTVRIWDAKSSETVKVFEGHRDVVTSISISPDMTRVASGSADKTIRFWDLKIFEESEGICEGHSSAVNSVSFAPDSARIASGSGDRTVKLWEVKTGKMIWSSDVHVGPVLSVACAPYTSSLASCSSDKTIRIHDLESGTQLAILEGHVAPVVCIAYNAKGNLLASCSNDKSFRVWDAKGYLQLREVDRHVGTFTSICWSGREADEPEHIVTASTDKILRVWSIEGQPLGTLEGHLDNITSVSGSETGTHVVSASTDKTVRIWDLKAEQQVSVLKGQSGVFTSVACSPDGHLVAAGSDDRAVRIFNAKTNALVAVCEGHADKITAVAFSPLGTQLASASDDQGVRLWDPATGLQINTSCTIQTSSGPVTCLAYSSDGSRLLTGSADTYKTVRIWDTSTGAQLMEARGHFGIIHGVAFWPDGSRALSASADRTIRMWDTDSGSPILSIEASEQAVTCLAVCPSSLRILSGGFDKLLKLWACTEPPNRSSYKNWACMAVFTGHVQPLISVVWHPDGTMAASSGGGGVRLWAIPPPKPAASHRDSQGFESMSSSLVPLTPPVTAQTHNLPRHHGLVNCITFSPNGALLATASYDKTIRIWEADSGRVSKVMKGHTGAVLDVAWSHCSMWLASAGADEVVRVWNVSTGYEVGVLQGHSNWVRCLSFSNPQAQPPLLRLVSGSDSGELKVWNVSSIASGDGVKRTLHAGTVSSTSDMEGHQGAVLVAIWAPDNSKIASCSEDRCIRLWDAKTSKTLFLLDSHSEAVTTLAFSFNGQLFASGGEDKVVRLWNPVNGKLLAEFGKGQIFGPVTRVRFSPDGSHLGGASVDKVFRVFSTRTLAEVAAYPSTNDGMWAHAPSLSGGGRAAPGPSLLLTFSSDLGVLRIFESSSLEDLASVFFTFAARDVAFNGRVAACSVVGTDSVALYSLLNLTDAAAAAFKMSKSQRMSQAGLKVDVQLSSNNVQRGSPSPTRSPERSSPSPRKGKSPSPRARQTSSPTSPLTKSQVSPVKKRGFK